MICKWIVNSNIILKKPEIIGVHTVKRFLVLLFNISNSIDQVFLSNIKNLHTVVWFQITNNNDNPQ